MCPNARLSVYLFFCLILFVCFYLSSYQFGCLFFFFACVLFLFLKVDGIVISYFSSSFHLVFCFLLFSVVFTFVCFSSRQGVSHVASGRTDRANSGRREDIHNIFCKQHNSLIVHCFTQARRDQKKKKSCGQWRMPSHLLKVFSTPVRNSSSPEPRCTPAGQ